MIERSTGISTPGIAHALLPHVSETQLTENHSWEYQKVTKDMPSSLLAYKEAAEQVLLHVPLVHGTERFEDAQQILQEGVVPTILRSPAASNNTRILDKSLGLHEYGFASVGQLDRADYGDHRVLIDARILYREEAIVTPFDLMYRIPHGQKDTPYNQQLADTQDGVRYEYFGEMLRGRDWLDITALKILKAAWKSRGEVPGLDWLVGSEVKVHGGIPKEYIKGYVDSDQAARVRDGLAAHGVIVSNYGKGQPMPNAGEEAPEVTAGRQVWRSILGIDPTEPVIRQQGLMRLE